MSGALSSQSVGTAGVLYADVPVPIAAGSASGGAVLALLLTCGTGRVCGLVCRLLFTAVALAVVVLGALFAKYQLELENII